MGLETDADQRCWRDSSNEVVMRSMVWAETADGEPGDVVESGVQLRASRKFVAGLLERFHVDLIVKITIRQYRRGYHASEEGDATEEARPKAKLYLVRADGSTQTV